MSQQNASIRFDWVAFTLRGLDLTSQETVVMGAIEQLNNAHIALGFEKPFNPEFWQLLKVPNHKPYSYAFSIGGVEGLIIMGSDKRSEVLIEMQGRFCATYPNMALDLAVYFQNEVTRIDVACDILTPLSPTEGVKGHKAKTVTESISQSGETVYLGSSTSEFMARIYRYNKPHPRADLLRSEIVYRRDYAKKLASLIGGGQTLENVVTGYWQKMGLNNLLSLAVFGNEGTGVKVQVSRDVTDKTMDKRRRWLKMQVAPAIEKMYSEGVTIEQILECLPLLSDYLRGEK